MPPPKSGDDGHHNGGGADDNHNNMDGGSVVDTDKRLKWLEARLAAAFRPVPGASSTTAIPGGRSVIDTRKVFEHDEVRRDVTAFLDSESCSLLYAFLKRSANGTMNVTISANPTPADLGGAAGTTVSGSGGNNNGASSSEGANHHSNTDDSASPSHQANATTTASSSASGGGGPPPSSTVSKILVIRKNTGVKTISIGNMSKEMSTMETNPALLRMSQTLLKDVFRPILAGQIEGLQKPPTTLTREAGGSLAPAPPTITSDLGGDNASNSGSATFTTSTSLNAASSTSNPTTITAPARKHFLSEFSNMANIATIACSTQEGLSSLPLPIHQYREKTVQIGSHSQQNAREVERLAMIWIQQFEKTIQRAIPDPTLHTNDYRLRPHPKAAMVRNILISEHESGGGDADSDAHPQQHGGEKGSGGDGGGGEVELQPSERLVMPSSTTTTAKKNTHAASYHKSGVDVGLAIIDPLDEIRHWEDHLLEARQMTTETESPLFKRSLDILKASNSSYYAPVHEFVKRVRRHLKFVKRVNKSLKPLVPFLLAVHPGRPATSTLPTDTVTSQAIFSKGTSNSNSKKHFLSTIKAEINSCEQKVAHAQKSGDVAQDAAAAVESAQRFLAWVAKAPLLSANVDIRAVASSNIISEIFNMLFLLWEHTDDAYPSSTRLAGIMLGIFENIIFSCDQFLDLENTFLDDSAEVKERGVIIFEVMRKVKAALFTFKSRAEHPSRHNSDASSAAAAVLESGAPSKENSKVWGITNVQLLKRVDQYLERINDLLSIVRSREVFTWLHHTELSGVNGHKLHESTIKTVAKFEKHLKFTYVVQCGALGLITDPSDLFDDLTTKFLMKRVASVEVSIASGVAAYVASGSTMCASLVRAVQLVMPQILLQPTCAIQRDNVLQTVCRRWNEDLQIVNTLVRNASETAAKSIKGGSVDGGVLLSNVASVALSEGSSTGILSKAGAHFSSTPAQSIILLLNILRRLTDLQRQVQLLFEDCASRSKPESTAAALNAQSQSEDDSSNNNNNGMDEVEHFKKASDVMWQAVRQFPICVDSFRESYSLFASVVGKVLVALGEAMSEWKGSLPAILEHLGSPLLHLDEPTQQFEVVVHPDIASAAREASILSTILCPKELKALQARQPHLLPNASAASSSSIAKTPLDLTLPQEAHLLLNAKSTLWERQVSLQASVDQYNQIRKSVKPHERALLGNELYHLECIFTPGRDALTWKSGEELDAFNERCAEGTRAMSETLSLLRSHVRELQSLLGELVDMEDQIIPLQNSKIGDRTFLLHTLQERFDAQLEKRRGVVEQAREYLSCISDRALKTVNEVRATSSSRALEAARAGAGGRSSIGSSAEISSSEPVDPEGALWKQFLDYIDQVVLEGSRGLINLTYSSLRKQLDPTWIKKHDSMPLLEARLEVTRDTDSGISLMPSLREEIQPLILRLKDDPLSLIKTLPIDPIRKESLANALSGDLELRRYERFIAHCLEDCQMGVDHYVGTLSQFQEIWSPTMVQDVEKELSTGYFPVYKIPLDTIKERIRHFQHLGHKVGEINNTKVILGWLKVDCRGAKETLRKNAHECLSMYVQHIHSSIKRSLQHAQDFSKNAREQFDADLSTLDTEDSGVVRTLVALIRSVREEDSRIMATFQPMLHGLRMISSMGAIEKEEEETLNEEIEKREPEWVSTLNKSIAIREQLAGVYDREVASLKTRIKAFEADVVGAKRKEFLASPLCTSITHLNDPYTLLDRTYKEWKAIEAQANNLLEEQTLYDIQVTTFEDLGSTLIDLQKSKMLWDVSNMSVLHIGEWMEMPFKHVDTSTLVDETRKIARHFTNSSGTIKETKSFIHAEKRITRVLASMPLIQDLRSGSLRERHWKQLLALCAKEAAVAASVSDNTGSARKAVREINPMNESTTLGDLLSLNLHHHNEAIAKLVERAEKEVAVEATLKKIIAFWETATLPIQHCPHDVLAAPQTGSEIISKITQQFQLSSNGEETHGSDVVVLGAIDELREVLEEHLNQLQTLQASRWSDYFKPTIHSLHQRLSIVDICISTWVDSQKLWCSLFPIFSFGLDMRAALKDDTAAFDKINERFLGLSQLVLSTSSAPNVPTRMPAIDACTTLKVPGVISTLESPNVLFQYHHQTGDNALHNGASVNLTTTTNEKQLLLDEHLVENELQLILDVLSRCEASLASYLETKRQRFPRLFFVSDADLTAMLSKANHPPKVCEYINKIILSVERCVFTPLIGESALEDQYFAAQRRSDNKAGILLAKEALDEMVSRRSTIISVISVEGEELQLPIPFVCEGQVEVWLGELIDAIQNAVRVATLLANAAYNETPREKWMMQHIAQVTVIVSRIHWTAESTIALEAVEDGNLSALGDHANHLKNQLSLTIEAIGGNLSSCDRKTIITLITVDVHARDIIMELIQRRVDSTTSFSWLKQLRFYMESASTGQLVSLASRIGQYHSYHALSHTYDAFASSTTDGLQNVPPELSEAVNELKGINLVSGQICDTGFSHGFEYVGNCGCLVVTPLTDRCYITLTQALKLHKGGAPAGPAGTGKTETVKDIAHALGFPVYVFNCSDQMDYMSVGAIFKGLAMSGAWGCFDEFNRIAVEVLSVVAAQVKSVLDSCRRKSPTFSLLGQELALKPSVGLFITMNPGYKGRTELPENVKASFRPCAMVAPDIGHICEIMLSAEGFIHSKELAKKFVRLYQLNAELLSPQEHYDWGLRAIRAVLFIAGSLKRSQPKDVDERSILLSALRDANMAKLAKGDVHMFNRLLAALFPNIKDTIIHDPTIENAIKTAASDMSYSLGDSNIVCNKILQFFDLINVRHSLFILGPTGSGKSSLLRIAKRAIEIREKQAGGAGMVTMECFDPKAITPHELYGWVMPQTREWKDGILSRTFREFATSPRYTRKGGTASEDDAAESEPQGSLARSRNAAGHHNASNSDDGSAAAGESTTSRGVMDASSNIKGGANTNDAMTTDETTKQQQHTSAPVSLAQQWIVLDGAVDADWIESMNSVMDDNKLLTLANNERIVMSSSMRLIFEITHLQHATLATVSRAGILYIGEGELGWTPIKERWLSTKVPEHLKTHIDILFDRFVPSFLDYVIGLPKTIVPMTPYAYVRSLCDLLESLLVHPSSPFAQVHDDVNAKVFLYCCIWTFGSCISYPLGVVDYRAQFSAFVRREFGEDMGIPTSYRAFASGAAASQSTAVRPSSDEVKSPTTSSDLAVGAGAFVFDWCLVPSEDNSRVMWKPWIDASSAYRSISEGGGYFSSEAFKSKYGDRMDGNNKEDFDQHPFDPYGGGMASKHFLFAYDPYCPLTEVILPTMDMERHVYLLNALARAGKHALLVGSGGTGKSALARYLCNRGREAAYLSELLSTQYGMSNQEEIVQAVASEQHVGRVQFLASDAFQFHTIHLNGLTDSATFQIDLESKLEKRVGRQFGPASRKKLIVVVENLNLPSADKYGSQSALALLRQHIDRGFWYDRTKLTPKDVVDQHYIVTMNPTVGTGMGVPDRLLQRLFAIGIGNSTDGEGTISLLRAMTEMGLTANNTKHEIKTAILDLFIPALVNDVWAQTIKKFLPTASSFHYSFTLRDMSRICQGLLVINEHTPNHSVPMIALYQLQAVLGDRMANQDDRDAVFKLAIPAITSSFSLFGVFATADGKSDVGDVADISGEAVPVVPFETLLEDADGLYSPVPLAGTPTTTCSQALQILRSRLDMLENSPAASSNGNHSNLVFFDQAVQNIMRISRILCYPGGNAVLVGVSGSGKRSLARLAAHLSLFEAITPKGTATSSLIEFNNEMSRIVMKCATKNGRVCLIISETDCLTDAMISVLDTFLANFHMDSALSVDTKDELKLKMANEIRVAGGANYADPDVGRARYIATLRNNLRIILALNPTVTTLTKIMRSFPSLQTQTQIIYFHSWPQDALLCVADGAISEKQRLYRKHTQKQQKYQGGNDGAVGKMLLPVALPSSHPAANAVFFDQPNIVVKPRQRTKYAASAAIDPEVAEAMERKLDEERANTSPEVLMQRAVCLYMAQCHLIARDFCERLHIKLKKRAYVTPKTFLTFVEFSCKLLAKRRRDLLIREQRLEGGLAQLKRCGEQITTLRGELNEFRIAVEEKARFTNELLLKVSEDRGIVEEQNLLAKREEDKTNRIVAEVDALVAECKKDLLDAEPIVVAARAALNTLDKNNLTELKSMGSPPKDVQMVTGCVMAILAPGERSVPSDRSWAASRRMMQDVTQWMKKMENMDYNNIPQANIDAIFKTVHEDYFNPDAIKAKSVAASSLCRWVVNVVKFHQVRVMVKPKELRLDEANHRLHISKTQLAKVQKRVAALQAKLDGLEAQYQQALDERNELESQLNLTQGKMQRAQRLLVSLGGERGRWGASLCVLDESKRVLDGDSLIGAAFVTYSGAFPTELREELLNEFREALKNNTICSIPFTEKVERGKALGVIDKTEHHHTEDDHTLEDIPEHISEIGGDEEEGADKIKSSEITQAVDATAVGDKRVTSGLASRRSSIAKSMVRRKIETDEANQKMEEEAKHAEPLNPVSTVFSEIDVARWVSEGLPLTRHMEQNAAVALASNLWSLVLDPQYQALRWLQGRAAAIAQIHFDQEHPQHQHNNTSVDHDESEEGTTIEKPDPSKFMVTLRQGDPGFLDNLLSAAERGVITLIDGITPDSGIDPALQPLLDKDYLRTPVTNNHNHPHHDLNDTNATGNTTGEFEGMLVIGDREVRVRRGFTLFLRCGSSNPIFQPDVFARTVVVDFCVTEKGLQELLLSVTVQRDKPELEESRTKLASDMNRMTISLLESETILLEQLSTADGDILQNEPLVHTLESAKQQSVDMARSLVEARETNVLLKSALDYYQPIASRGALMYVCLAELCKVDNMYYYSIDAFIAQFERAINICQQDATTALGGPQRTTQLELAITKGIYAYVNRSLFAKHKFVFAAALSLLIAARNGDITSEYLAFLVRCPRKVVGPPPLAVQEWLTEGQWANLNALADISGPAIPFRQLLDECADTLRWRIWAEHAAPEGERLPGDWKQLKPFEKLMIIRCLRTDRMGGALRMYISEAMGAHMFDDYGIPLDEVLEESPVISPILFVLSPGSDPSTSIDAALTRVNAKKLAATQSARKASVISSGVPPSVFQQKQDSVNSKRLSTTSNVSGEHGRHPSVSNGSMVITSTTSNTSIGIIHVSMGQGQEARAEEAIRSACLNGGWVALHNVHLMRKWIHTLDRMVGRFSQDTTLKVHPDYRLILSAEPVDHIPSTLLQASTKLVDEPPAGLRANFSRAYSHYADEPWEHSTKPQEFHAIVFGMCFFHAVVVERSKFGPTGWNRKYPFNYEDLKACTDVLAGYLEERPRVPWEDLRYVFGEIMYGGHITDRWDSRVCKTYLAEFINPDTIDVGAALAAGSLSRGGGGAASGAEIVPGVPLPNTRSYSDTLEMIQDALQEEGPRLFLINPLSENRARAADAKEMFGALLEVLPQTRNDDAQDDDSQLDKLSMLMGAVPDSIPLLDITDQIGEDMSPLQHVFLQECERLNRLSDRMRLMLEGAEAAIKGTVTMTPEIDELLVDLQLDRVPAAWLAVWGPTRRPLASWTAILADSNTQLSNWALDLLIPRCVNISCMFIPIAFLTALQQETALRTNSELDNMGLVVEVTKRAPSQIDLHARDGCFVYGPSLEGASWDTATNSLQEVRVKDGMVMPVMVIRAAHTAKIDRSDTYACPVYSTTARATTYVTTLHLKTRAPPSTWTLRGTAMILDGAY